MSEGGAGAGCEGAGPTDGRALSAAPPSPATQVAGTRAEMSRARRRTWLGAPAWADVAMVDVLFLAFICLVAAMRWRVLVPLSLPTGADGGNWLALGRALGHQTAVPGGVVYPPLVPALALAASALGKPIAGLKLVAAIAGVVPAAGCYAAARITGLRWTAVVPCAFLAVAGSVSEAAAWGGYPQLMGLGLMPVALALLDRALRSWGLGAAALAGLALAATLSANELIGAVALLAAVLLVGVRVAVLRSRPPSLARLAAVAALAVAPSLLLVPTYAQLLAAVWSTRGAKPAHANIAVRDILPYVYRDLPAFWYPAQLLAVAVPATVLLGRRRQAWPLVVTILAAAAILLVGLRQVRFGYVMPLTAVLGLAAWIDALELSGSRLRRTAASLLAVALVPILAYQSLVNANLFRVQVAFYAVVPGDWVPVMTFLRERTPPGSLVAVGPDAVADPTGWWVQGLGQRPALISSDPAWLNFPEERARAREAQWIFDPSVSAAESLRRARKLGVAYLLVDKRWPHYQAWHGAGAGLRVALDEPDVALVEVRAR
jgi:hypothetical protein